MLVGLLLGCSLEPPEVEVRWPDAPGPIATDLVLEVTANGLPPRAVEVRVARFPMPSTLDPATGRVLVPVDALPEGLNPVQVDITSHDWLANHALAELSIRVDTTAPALTLPAAPASAGQGRTAVVWVRSDEPLVTAVLHAFERDLPLFPVAETADGTAYRALVGVPLEAGPGHHVLSVDAADLAGNLVHQPVPLVVDEVDYPKGGTIRLSKAQVEARKDDEAKAEMRAHRDAAYALLRPETRFVVPFQRPVEGRTTSPFGVYRTYSDGGRSFHTGLDLANRAGTPVVAAAPGEVVMAEEQAIFGNAVIVHHGQGVTTSYNHLQRIDCAVGDRLEAGAPIGRLGSTGQSTGPHLHFSMVVGEEAVDPAQWLDGALDLAPPTWSPHP